MLKIAVHGICGKMGEITARMISERKDMSPAFGIDPFAGEAPEGVRVYKSVEEVPESEKCDVIIDFSNFRAVPALLSFAVSRKIPVVVCTTGLDAETKRQLVESASAVPVFHSANMSMGIALMRVLAAKAAAVLGDSFDIEIVERHHNRKIDAPSGTAIMLADAIDTVWDGRYDYVFDRHSRTEKRSKYEIGISSVRGGNIVGDHEVIFAGENEVIELTHRAQSREVFAEGAIKAAVFLADKDRGIYTMDDLVGGF